MSRTFSAHWWILVLAALFWSQGIFAAKNEQIRIHLEEPISTFNATGISTIRGWAVGPAGVGRVELYINGTLRTRIPYGGPRGDVCSQFSNYPNCDRSGFAMAYNFGQLTPGNHQFRIVAHAPNGDYNEVTRQVSVRGFHAPYISNQNALNLAGASFQAQGNDLLIRNAQVDGRPYDLTFRWNRDAQAPRLFNIGAASGSDGGGLQVAGQWKMFSEMNATSCGEGVSVNSSTMSISQSENTITFNDSVSGTLQGGTVTIREEYVEGGERIVIDWVFQFNSSGEYVRANGTWNWHGPGGNCGGSTYLVGSRM